MTSANVETVRSIYAAWQSGDFGSSDWADPEIELTLADGPAPGTRRGLAAMSWAWGETLGAFEDFQTEAEGIRALDSERVLVLTHNSGRRQDERRRRRPDIDEGGEKSSTSAAAR